MTSRLDRLFLLLDQGSSTVTRKAAAQQLGEVQKFHPHELNNLLSTVRQYLHSSSWDTRIAASQAVEAIISNVEPWCPSGRSPDEDNSVSGDDEYRKSSGRMLFENFDINTVIKHGRDLLGSDGSEFDPKAVDGTASTDPAENRERLANQRRLLNQRLGLDVADKLNLGLSSEELISNDDLADSVKSEPKVDVRCTRASLRDTINEVTNATKRRVSNNGVAAKKIKKEVDESSQDQIEQADKTIDFNTLKEWPFESFCDELMSDLFSASWESKW